MKDVMEFKKNKDLKIINEEEEEGGTNIHLLKYDMKQSTKSNFDYFDSGQKIEANLHNNKGKLNNSFDDSLLPEKI